MEKSKLAKTILYAFIDGLSTARDKKEQLKKLIDDFEIALIENTDNEEMEEKKENKNQLKI